MNDAELAARGFSRETKIRRDAKGRWFEDDVLVEHAGMHKAFDSWVSRAPDGRLCLQNSIHWVYVEIEGPPVFVRSLRITENGVHLRLSTGREERLVIESLYLTQQGEMFCLVHQETLEARFDSAPLAMLADLLQETDEGYTLQIGREFVTVPTKKQHAHKGERQIDE